MSEPKDNQAKPTQEFDIAEALKNFKEKWEKEHPNTGCCHTPWTCPRCGYPNNPLPIYPYYTPPHGPYYYDPYWYGTCV